MYRSSTRAHVLLLIALLVCGSSAFKTPTPLQHSLAPRNPPRSHDHLVTQLVEGGVIADPRVEAAMRRVDRAHYVSELRPGGGSKYWSVDAYAYADEPRPIGFSQVIAAPRVHAHALMHLREHLVDGARALDVGTGSGFLAAAMAHMVGERGEVHGIDCKRGLVQLARANMAKHELPAPSRVALRVGDGLRLEEDRPLYDAIHVGTVTSGVPEALVNALRPGGRLIVPIADDERQHSLIAIDKDDDECLHWSELLVVCFGEALVGADADAWLKPNVVHACM